MSSIVSGCLGPDITRDILESGRNFDGFDDQLFALRGRVDGGALAFGEVSYGVVVLPGVERMPLATLRALETFAREGGILIATRRLPAIVPGYLATEAEQNELRAIVRRLFLAPGAPGIFLPDEGEFAAALNRRLAPDAGFAPAAPDLGVVHRHTADAEIYFLANTSGRPISTQGTFRVAGLEPEWWNLMDGGVERAAVIGRDGRTTTVAIELPAFGSRALVFASRHLPAAAGLGGRRARAARPEHRLVRDLRRRDRPGGDGAPAILDGERGHAQLLGRGHLRKIGPPLRGPAGVRIASHPDLWRGADGGWGTPRRRPSGGCGAGRRAGRFRCCRRRPGGARRARGRRLWGRRLRTIRGSGARSGRRVRERGARRLGLASALPHSRSPDC